MGFDDARHLLSRTTFGGTPAEIAALEPLDFASAVDRLLRQAKTDVVVSSPPWVTESPIVLREARDKTTVNAKGQTVKLAQKMIREHAQELRNWWVEQMLETDHPLVEKMTLFWHNHFTSSVQKVRFVPALYWQNVLFRRHALGNFAGLLRAVARDPAMLIYLDGVQNLARQPNENFGRELLELFTLGEGHYSEADIKNAARAFTGWGIDRDTGQFLDRMAQHDNGEKTFLGEKGHFNGDDIITIVLRQPRTAETIVEKLWREFVSLRPDATEVKRLAAVFRSSGYEMKPLMRELLLSAAFRDPANRAALIKSPIELMVGTVHLLGMQVADKTQLVRMMAGLGQSPFDPPNVKGWPGGESWITTNTLLLRQQFLRRIIEASTVSTPDGRMMNGANRRMDRRQQMGPGTTQAPNGQGGDSQGMEQLPIEGRSLRNAAGEARLGPTLAGVDAATLTRTLLPRQPIDVADAGGSPGAVVAADLLDPAYQLK
jgi:uncharacterized protein (DUF1800 family)